ncbi:MAG: gliding motility-associated C-terminal domain-containing protein [Crocinitomicaceae bacterium]
MIRKITLLGLSFFAMCWQVALSQQANFTIDPGNSICVNECIVLNDISTSPVNITNWVWSITSTVLDIPTIPNPNDQQPGDICFTSPGVFSIQLDITDANGNVSNANVQLTVVSCPGSISAGFTVQETVCVGDCIVANDTSQGTPTSWNWSLDVTPITAAFILNPVDQNPTICFETVTADPIGIELKVTDVDGKVSKFTKQITVIDIPTVVGSIDTIVELGDPAFLSAVATSPIKLNYQWEPSETATNAKGLATNVYPIETTSYVIRVEDTYGCFAEDTVKVYLNFLPQIGVPTAFSPNGDGKNDLLVVEGLALDICIFKIYNRYGKQIFESTVQKNGWDGNFRGKAVGAGVFYWTLEYEFNTGQAGTLSGNTTLVR